MDEIKEAIFFGTNYKIAQIVNKFIHIREIYCEKRSFNKDLYNYVKLNSIPFHVIETRAGLSGLSRLANYKGLVGISCGFGIIFKKCDIMDFEHGIWNIHYGKLPDFRGRHPISWGFLKGNTHFGVTIHEIDEKIDCGNLLSEGVVFRDLNDTQNEIEGKIEELIENKLFGEAIDHYLLGEKVKLSTGVYYENLINKFADVSPQTYDSVFLFNLFKSQRKYGGVTINGKNYLECVFVNDDYSDLYSEYQIIVCRDGAKMGIK